jgi:hypothetical protein
MRVLICGSRKWNDRETMEWEFRDLPMDAVIIHGGAPGADRLAGKIAKDRQMRVEVYAAEWDKYGTAAGPRRNQRMLDEGHPDLVLAFPLAESRGTWDMVRRAKLAGVEVRVIKQRKP